MLPKLLLRQLHICNFGIKSRMKFLLDHLGKGYFWGGGAVVLLYETKLAVSTTITTTAGVRGRNMRISGLGRSSMQSLNHQEFDCRQWKKTGGVESQKGKCVIKQHY